MISTRNVPSLAANAISEPKRVVITITRRTIKKTKSDRFLIRKFWEDEGIGFNQSVFDLSDNYDRQQNNLMDRNRLIFVISVLERRVILSQLKYIPSFTVGHEKEGMVA